MSLFLKLKSRWKALTARSRAEKELDAEVRFYLDMLADEKVAQGLTEAEARRCARLDAGGVDQIKEAVRDVRAGAWLEMLWQDLKHAARQLHSSTAFTWTAVVSLALGIGANAALFTVVRAVLIAPLPYPGADRLVVVWGHNPSMGAPKDTVSHANYADWRQQNRVFSDMAACVERAGVLLGGEESENISGYIVTGDAFGVLGAPALLGRVLTPADDLPGERERVVIISYELWQRRFSGAADVIGRRLSMHLGLLGNDQPDPQWTIVGVMPRGFHLFSAASDFWIPARYPPAMFTRRGSRNLKVLARLRPGVTLQQAQADMSGIAARLEREYPTFNQRLGAVVLPMREELAGESTRILPLLQGAACCILLIACANLANLLASRGKRRTREIAMRAALGAGRIRLLRQLLTESILLAVAGAALGLALADSLSTILPHLVPRALSRTVSPHLDLPAFGFAAAISLLTALLFGFGPAWHLSNTQIGEALKQGGAAGAGRSHGRLRNLLVVAEVSVALLLTIGAGLLIRTVTLMTRADPGFQPAGLLTMRIAPRYADPVRRDNFYREALERIRALPGVVDAGFVNQLPFKGAGQTGALEIEGRQIPEEEADAEYRATAGDYLQTLGARLREGRLLTPQDRADTEPVVVINDTFARLYWPAESPLGKRFKLDGRPFRTIVGVIADLHERGLDSFPKPVAYTPAVQRNDGRIPAELAVRTSVPPMSLAPGVRSTITAIEPKQAISAIQSMQDIVDAYSVARRDQMFVLNAFAFLALLLAVVGVYGFLWYSVTHRTREIAVRMALGATRGDILRLVSGLGLRLIVAGTALGVFAALALTHLINSILFGVSAIDPLTFTSASVVIVGSGFLSSLLPARLASRQDPVITLRNE
jgi:putative ABC transport system permease protein